MEPAKEDPYSGPFKVVMDLLFERQVEQAVKGTGGATSRNAQPRTAATNPTTRLTAGPAMAMRNSARGDGDSRVMWAIPPSRNRLIVRTGMPKARATRACGS